MTRLILLKVYRASFMAYLAYRDRNHNGSAPPRDFTMDQTYRVAKWLLQTGNGPHDAEWRMICENLVKTGSLYYTALHQGLDRAMVVKLSRP